MTQRHILLSILLASFATLWGQTPSATLEYTGSTAFCESGTAQLKIKFTGTPPFGYSIRITKGSGQTFVINNSQIFTENLVDGYWIISESVTEATTYQLHEVFDGSMTSSQWQLNKGSTNVSGSVTFQIDHMPTANAGTDQSSACGYSTALSATPQFSDSEIYWTTPLNGTLSDSNSASPTFTATAAGTYTLTFNEKRGACIDQDDVLVTILGSPKATLSGQAEICATGNLPAQLVLEGQSPWSFTVRNSGGSQSVTQTNVTNSTYNFSIPATGSQTYTLTEVTDGNGCSADATDLNGEAAATNIQPSVFAGNDKIICGRLETTLEGDADKGTVKWTSVPTTAIANETALNSNTSAPAFGYVEYTLTATNNGCEKSDAVTLHFAALPNLLNAYLDAALICEGSHTSLVLLSDTEGLWTLRYTANEVASALEFDNKSEKIDLSPTVTTTYTLNEIIDQYGCKNTQFENGEHVLTVEKVEIPDAGTDQTLDRQYQTQLDATTSTASGEWQLISGGGETDIVSKSDPQTIVSKLSVGENKFRWTLTPLVCPVTYDDVSIFVNKYTTYNGISPNGDGFNDRFIIEGAYSSEENELLVFTMKGKLVYKAANYQNDWTGLGTDGKPLEDGTYYYVFTSKSQSPVKDYLVIRR
ncbi:MAG: gliding motility-associated C-terminal domain-containing protein [Breznakibacter sp.]